MPQLVWPELGFEHCVQLPQAAFTIAVLGVIESLLSAVVADGMAGTRHDSNQELIGQEIGNLVSPLFGGIAATGDLAHGHQPAQRSHQFDRRRSPFDHASTDTVVSGTAGGTHSAVLARGDSICGGLEYERGAPFRANGPDRVADTAILLMSFALMVVVDLVVAVSIGVILKG